MPGWIRRVSGRAAEEINTRGPRISPPAAASGSRSIVPRICSAASPILIVVADTDPKPAEDRRIDHGARNAVAAGERGTEILRRCQNHLSIKRIGGVYRLQFDQALAAAIGRARHRPQRGDLGQRAAPRQIGVFGGVHRAIGELRLGIAAEELARVAGDAGGQRRGERADAGNRPDAEHEAGDQDTQPGDAAAQLAAGEADRVAERRGPHNARRAAPN